jgi:glycosyltransferase involved in cell wall biosynthesis
MNDYLVSVIIPTYSRPIRLKKAILSVLRQTYKNIEIIIIDDNNPGTQERKETEELINSLNHQSIRYLVHERNMGANAARNTGISNSKGDFIAFLDDDDEYVSTKIEEQINVIKELSYNESGGILVFTGAKRIGDPIYKQSKWMNMINEYLYHPDPNLIYTKNFIGSNSYVMIDKKSLTEINAFDTNLESCQDWDVFIRLAMKNTKFIGINRPLVIYHAHEEKRITNNYSKKIEGHLKIMTKLQKPLSEISKKYSLSFYRYLFYQFLEHDKIRSKEMLLKIWTNSQTVKDYLNYLIDLFCLLFAKHPVLLKKLRKLKNFLITDV